MNMILPLALISLVSFTANADIADICSRAKVRWEIEDKLIKKLKADCDAGDAQACQDYYNSGVEWHVLYKGRANVFSDLLAPDSAIVVDYDCKKQSLKFREFYMDGDVTVVREGSASLDFSQADRVNIAFAERAYELRLDTTDTNWGKKIRYEIDTYSGYLGDFSNVVVSGKVEKLNPYSTWIASRLFFPPTVEFDNSNVKDPNLVYGKQLDYQEIFKALDNM